MLYLKAKIIELLTLQFFQYEEEKTVGLKQEDIEKMTMVKALIESNINEVYSLAYLARVAGTNEQYLKKHFKILFGSTVFGYMLACKMEKAKELLSTGKHKITEVSETVGYKHATHFTTAFKKFFGYLPSLAKRNFMFGGCFWFNVKAEIFEVLIMV
ncbi:helix-turn-helix domain-containing protein [Pedobacter arcticus]|uniref:helix-turn-helix domain-containing protein n=1 Tax=Pedobacter arcticus TaxID=752140 RepID=UPI0002FB60FC|nr:AraC family transcriptional regulator [Pedobacter arcticus]